MSFFQRDTSLEPAGSGRYRGELSPAWNCPIVPQGGMVAAVAARGMAAELAHPEQTLRSLNLVFAAPVAAGPIEVEVTVLRRGRSMSQLAATVRNPGAAAGLTALSVFGRPREGYEFTDIALPPGIPSPLECPSYRDPPPDDWDDGPPFPFWEHVEGRAALGNPPWDDYEPESSLLARWIRFDDPPRADDGTWDPCALIALSDTMPGAVGQRLGPQRRQRPWIGPSVDLTLHLFDEARGDWLLGVNRARHAGDGYASVDIETWDCVDGEAPRLVAYATQMMFFNFLEP